MQLKVPFFYTSNIDVLDGPKGVTRIVFDVMDIEVREATQAEAPIALSFEERAFDWTRRLFRTHDGDFYGGFITKAGRESTRRIAGMKPTVCGSSPPRELIGFLACNGAYPFKTEWPQGAKMVERWWRSDARELPVGVISPYHVAKHNDDARAIRMRKIEEVATGLLSVDGWMHFRTAEPTLLISPGSLNVYADFGLPKTGEDFYRPNLRTSGRVLMSLADLDVAAAQAYRMANMEIEASVREIEVHIPEAFRFDALAYRAMVTATEMVNALKNVVGELPASAASAWVNLRALVAEGENGEVDTENLILFVTELADWSGHFPARFTSEIDILDGLAKRGGVPFQKMSGIPSP